jgi:predicted anti-sigma-YlaC factor YlaD
VITCKEAVARLYAYLDRNLGRVPEGEVEEHLKLCRHCCGELEFAKRVRELLRRPGPASALTPDARARFETFLHELKKRAKDRQ